MPLSTNNYAALPMTNVEQGIRTELATLLGPGANVAAYVRSGGAMTYDTQGIKKNLVATLDAGLARCRSDSTNMAAGFGDVVVVLPGHTESISSADQMSSLVPGTNIVCLGSGSARPTFNWTAATATFLFDQANTRLYNAVLNMAPTSNGGVTVAAPITVSAAGCGILGCQVQFGGDADDVVTIGITTTAAADDFEFHGNFCYGATAAECTTFLRLVGTDRLRMYGNTIIGATSSTTVGVCQMLTTAPTFVDIRDSVFVNNKALSVHAFTGLAGATGVVSNCHFGILDNATAAGFETEGSLQFFGCTTANAAGENSIPKTPQSV